MKEMAFKLFVKIVCLDIAFCIIITISTIVGGFHSISVEKEFYKYNATNNLTNFDLMVDINNIADKEKLLNTSTVEDMIVSYKFSTDVTGNHLISKVDILV
ncbi:MAG: hypothetical protein ACRC5M_00385, partial [Anaeroplasmataceae bacterium]